MTADKNTSQRPVAPKAIEVIPPGDTETCHWTTAKEVQLALANASIEDHRVMMAVPYKRVVKPRYLQKAVVIDATGVYPIVAIQELETEDGQKVLVLIGSEDVPPLDGPIERRTPVDI